MTLPNFVCVGVAKAGTTTLHNILEKHPDIFLPSIKETHFFAEDEIFARGIDWYESEFFSAAGEELAVGEITPTYLYLDEVPERLHHCLGSDLRLIFVFRHPVDRAYSQYLMTRRQGREQRTFEQAVASEMGGPPKAKKRPYFDYVRMGLYGEQLERYLKLFPENNMFFVVFEQDIAVNIEKTVERLQEFLGVPSHSLACTVESNSSNRRVSPAINRLIFTSHPGMKRFVRTFLPSVSTRKKLVRWLSSVGRRVGTRVEQPQKLDLAIRSDLFKKYFEQDVAKLEVAIKRDLSLWK